MQKGTTSGTLQSSLSKPLLLVLIAALVVGVVAPLIVPHLGHPSMIYHIALHIASLTIAVFLGMVSFLAFARSRGTRLMFMAFGFVALAVVEFLYLLDASELITLFDISTLSIELTHVILLAMLAMFGLGVLRVNK